MPVNVIPPHPAKIELVRRRISITALARRVGVGPGYLGGVLNGRRRPSPRVAAAAVSTVLGLPAEELFHADTLMPLSHYPGNDELDVPDDAA